MSKLNLKSIFSVVVLLVLFLLVGVQVFIVQGTSDEISLPFCDEIDEKFSKIVTPVPISEQDAKCQLRVTVYEVQSSDEVVPIISFPSGTGKNAMQNTIEHLTNPYP